MPLRTHPVGYACTRTPSSVPASSAIERWEYSDAILVAKLSQPRTHDTVNADQASLAGEERPNVRVPDQLAQSTVILAAPAVARWSTRKKLLRVVALAVSTIGRCDAASATLLGILDFDGEVCTSAVAYRLDQPQHGDGGGPCVDAVRFLQIFNVGCISTAATWHDYRVAAAADGIRSRPLGPADLRRRRHRHAQPLLGGSRRLRWLWNVAATYTGAAAAAMVPNPM
jgi:hypothetical protein